MNEIMLLLLIIIIIAVVIFLSEHLKKITFQNPKECRSSYLKKGRDECGGKQMRDAHNVADDEVIM